MPELLYRQLSFDIIGAAMEVHRTLGPGFLEAVYQNSLAHELSLRQIPFVEKKALPVLYKGRLVGDYEADIVVDDKIILELKAVSEFHPKHAAQAANYLAATGYRLALLLNFGADSFQSRRIIR